MISTRGRYALRVLVYLAKEESGEYIPMKNVAQSLGISLKYMERILPSLTKGGIVEGVQGKGGGYRLAVKPEECKIGDILRLTEGDLAPVACLEENAMPCDKKDSCPTISMWREFYELVNSFFDGKTLKDLCCENKNG